MAVSAPVITPAPAAVVASDTPRSVQWGAVILGALGATAISMVLLTFGAGIGLSATSAHPYAGASPKALAVISALYAAVSIVAAFAAGGYITGRMRLPATEDDLAEADFRDGAHGFGVWALALVAGGAIAASGAAGVIKTAMQTTAAVAGAASAGAASNPQLTSQISMNPVDYAVDRVLAPVPAANANPAGQGIDRTAAVTRAFTAAVKSGQLDQRDRATLVAIVQQQTGLPQAEAEKRVDEAYTEFKTAEQKVRDTAEAARKAALITAFGVAATLLLGCAAACVGASAGAKHRHERVAVTWFGSRRFW
jgi:hypothetical protein